MKPLVTVIIPAFNPGRYLDEALESIVNQSYTNIEILIRDDGSADETEKIIKNWEVKDKRVKGYFNKENMGVSYTLNRLVENSNGSFIVTMPADDICPTKLKLEKQLNFLLENPQIDIVGGQLKSFGTSVNKKNYSSTNFPQSDKDIKKYLHFCCSVVHGTIMARKCVHQLIPFNEKLPASVDYDFFLKCMEKGIKFYNFSDCFLNYRLHERQISSEKIFQQMKGASLSYFLYKQRIKNGKELFKYEKGYLNNFDSIFEKGFYFIRMKSLPKIFLPIIGIIGLFSRTGRFSIKSKLLNCYFRIILIFNKKIS
jgi:glycosyltransferase involved in cell wall biosynthesis